ncbi:MAG: FtsH protease activity modulator HflK [Salibaculum sp.]|jgi:membrane protease subunit HflK|uniref:FtsH protease activity modulator HflK n=1 Tax=Salibaculum sp. TaxID=2855480 RepID=UPI0028700E60|nr:FtsH protease activity modulator HflK [Salibaculum sp.]MDR9483025.1 FtsH protease activity modulator HflK [Salibaculum sp.]
MAGNNQGPWGGGGRGGGGDDRDRNNGGGGGRRPGQEPQMPEFDEIVTKTRDQLRVLMGGGGGKGGKPSGGGGGDGPQISRGMIGLGVALALVAWLTASFYTVRPEERSVELFLGECIEPCVGQPGLNFAPWPVVTAEVLQVTREQVIEIGEENVPGNLRSSRNTNQSVGADTGLMLTGDENIVEIGFQVVWNITSPHRYLFNLQNPPETIEAVAESSMREIIAQSQLANLNRERAVLRDRLQESVQSTLDEYDSGVNIIRINLDQADPPATEVDVINIDGESEVTSPLSAYRDVQDAEQERIQLQNRADAYANRVTAEARGSAAEILEGAEGYRARVVNEARGEAARFVSVLEEFQQAPDVTRERLYLETVEEVFGRSDLILLDEGGQGQGGVVPYLPLDQLRRQPTDQTTGGSN